MFILSEENSIANHIIAELRDVQVQQDSFKFRFNLERLGWILAYELSKSLAYREQIITTPLGTSNSDFISDQIVLATVMRAGLPFYQGFLSIFEKAESAFIGAYRVEESQQEAIQINMEYIAAPDLNNKILILIDPMLATGKSLVLTHESLLKKGTPKAIHAVSAIASKPGVQFIQKTLPEVKLWIGAVDKELNKQAYIVPGLGDAGDLSFGEKL